VSSLARTRAEYTLVMIDLDHFKLLNVLLASEQDAAIDAQRLARS
jgi:GGDEF domain-containing protein